MFVSHVQVGIPALTTFDEDSLTIPSSTELTITDPHPGKQNRRDILIYLEFKFFDTFPLLFSHLLRQLDGL